MHYKSSISLLSSAKQESEMTKFCVVWGAWTTTAYIPYFHLELNAIIVEHCILRISLVKYKFIFKGRCLLNTKVSSTKYWPCGKSGSLQGLLESAKKHGGTVATLYLEIISLESKKRKMKKEGTVTFSEISLEFALTYRKANTFLEMLRLHDKWYQKTIFDMF